MTKLLAGLFFYLMTFLVHAAENAEAPPVLPEVSIWPIIGFAAVFVAMVGGFIAYVWVKERDRKRRESQQS